MWFMKSLAEDENPSMLVRLAVASTGRKKQKILCNKAKNYALFGKLPLKILEEEEFFLKKK